ncbi:hypothetical protein Tco_0814600 [Tanacetum coccineum]
MSARIAEASALSPSSFRKRYRSSYETPSPSSSPTLPDEGPSMEEAAPEGQQQAVPVVDTAVSEPLGLGYGAARRHTLELTEEIAPSTFHRHPSSFHHPIRFRSWNIATTISVDEDHILEVGAQLKLLGSILHDHTQHLDALPLTLFEGYDKDLRKLYTRSGAFRDKIFLQRYRFRSLEQEQERATRENHNLRRQLAEERRERLELTYRVVRMERR